MLSYFIYGLLSCNALAETASLESQRWRVEPQLQVALLQPLGGGISFYSDPTRKAYLSAGWFQIPPWGGAQTVGVLGAELGARYFPATVADGRLHIGGGFGVRKIFASLRASSLGGGTDPTLASTATGDFYSIYVSLEVGWSFRLSERLRWMVGAGFQAPIFGWGSMSFDGTDGGISPEDSAAPLSRVARLPLPQITLMRLSWEL